MDASSVVQNRKSAMNNNGGDLQREHPQQYHHHPGAGGLQPQRQQFQSYQSRQFGAGNRASMIPGPLNSGINQSPIAGQKRDSSGFAVGGGGNPHGTPAQHESADGGNFVKLFVGSVPRTITEDDVRPLFAEHGNVLEVALIKDRRTGQQQDQRMTNAPKAASCCNYTLGPVHGLRSLHIGKIQISACHCTYVSLWLHY